MRQIAVLFILFAGIISLSTLAFADGEDFSGQILWGQDFSNNSYINTNFSNSELNYSDFSKSTLTGANFTDSIIESAKFSEVIGFTEEQLKSTLFGVDPKFCVAKSAASRHSLCSALCLRQSFLQKLFYML